MRCYASIAPDDPLWFQQLRDEMLQRDMTHLPEHITAPTEYKLSQTLYGSLPKELCLAPGFRNPVLPVGHHLIWFNPALPTRELLPDGTDASQSPGGPWVRRMWAGGSIQLRPDDYYDKARGLTLDTAMVGAERIKEVRLRGQDDATKIFVTIERRFARLDRLKERYREAHGSLGRTSGLGRSQRYFEEQIRQDEGWGDAILKEERNLVFMKERTTAELEAIKAGNMAAVKYLDRTCRPLLP
jgi:hydroxyacyl-ACP dehydratase HTD2-like protein with hotdog domain